MNQTAFRRARSAPLEAEHFDGECPTCGQRCHYCQRCRRTAAKARVIVPAGERTIRGIDHSGAIREHRVGDTVRVFPDLGGAEHPYGNGFEDTIRDVFVQTDMLGDSFAAVVLTRVSWVPLTEIE